MLEKLNHQPDEPGFIISLIKAPDDVIEGELSSDELVCSETQHPRLTHNGEHFLVPFSNIFPPFPHFSGLYRDLLHFLYGGKWAGLRGHRC